MTIDIRVERLLAAVGEVRAELATHPMYERMRTIDDVRVFMEHHVLAVWDFMSLLKALQRGVTCQALPWRPVGQAGTRRLVNEIILEEESDVVDGVATGHFELYLRAMDEVGADTRPICEVIRLLEGGAGLDEAMSGAGIGVDDTDFVRATFRFIETGKPHVIAAAFTFGREDSIPMMFRRLSQTVLRHRERTPTLLTYLDRHMQLDEEDHGPKAVEMVCQLCGHDDRLWAEAADAAREAILARLALWSSIERLLPMSRPANSDDVVEVAAAE